MPNNKNPQQSDSVDADGAYADRSNSGNRPDGANSRTQQFGAVRGATREGDSQSADSGSRDVESILDQLEQNIRSLRQAIGSDRSGGKDSERSSSSQTSAQSGGRGAGQSMSSAEGSAGGRTAGQPSTGKTGTPGSDKGQTGGTTGGQGAGRTGGQTGR